MAGCMAGAAALTVTLASPALAFGATATGSGSSSSAAASDARLNLISNYVGCGNITLIYDNYVGNGTWSAEVWGNCSGIR